MRMNAPLIAAVIAATVGPLLAYIAATRKLSGKIATSEAADLWAESGKIREDYRNRLGHADLRAAALEERVARLEHRNSELARENFDQARRIDTLERENAALKAQIARLETELAKKGA
jgi:hypothetical protein